LRPDSTLDRYLEILIAGAPFFVFGAAIQNIYQMKETARMLGLKLLLKKISINIILY
jgi:hypothetical protein